MQLGQGVCLARVPRYGRYIEYISGEDAHLGYEKGQPAVRGSQGARERLGRRVREREALRATRAQRHFDTPSPAAVLCLWL